MSDNGKTVVCLPKIRIFAAQLRGILSVAMRIVSWCNGSTTGFGSVCQGSNPCETTTEKGLYRIVKLPDCNPFFLCLISPPFNYRITLSTCSHEFLQRSLLKATYKSKVLAGLLDSLSVGCADRRHVADSVGFVIFLRKRKIRLCSVKLFPHLMI